MRRADLEKLLGGYSAGILTPDEEQALYAAALDDQELFDALAREQPLRDLLQDPVVRARLLATLSDQPVPWYRRLTGWTLQPRVLAACMVLCCLAATLTLWQVRHRREAPVLTAQVSPSPLPERITVAPNAAPVVRPSKPPAQPFKPPVARDVMAGPKSKALLDSRAVTDAPVSSDQIAANEPFAKKQELAEVKPGNAGVIGGVAGISSQASPPIAAESGAGAAGLQASALRPSPAAPPPPRQFDAGRLMNPVAPAAARKTVQVRSMEVRPQPSPLRWTIFRRRPGEEFVGGDAGNLQAGDEVKLRIESNTAGYVYVVEKQLPLASSHLESGQSFETVIQPGDPGQRTLSLWFSDRPMEWSRAIEARPGLFSAGSGAQQAKDAGSNVAAPAGAGGNFLRPVPTTITLNYQ